MSSYTYKKILFGARPLDWGAMAPFAPPLLEPPLVISVLCVCEQVVLTSRRHGETLPMQYFLPNCIEHIRILLLYIQICEFVIIC